ncbi:MAG: hypothetical protein LC115_00880 [Bacteroidia bacterium]|nr:hypothetical protein [Bacteroidia bacterium]
MILSIALVFALGSSFKPSKPETLAMLFSFPDGATCEQPCLLGIQPDVTTPNQAIDLMKIHPYTKDNEIRKTQYSGQDYLNVGLGQSNALQIKVDYELNKVLEVALESGDNNDIEINGVAINWSDILSDLGSPKAITASAGDGGFVSLAVGLYSEGWCVHARPENADDHPPAIPLDEKVMRIEINCFFLENLEDFR